MQKHKWLHFEKEDLQVEYLQAEQEGRDLSSVRERFQELFDAKFDEPETQEACRSLMDDVQSLPLRAHYPFREPTDLAEIRKLRPVGARRLDRQEPQDIADKILGGWLGRCCGCLLGKPVEGWRRLRLNGYLQETRQWPLRYYISLSNDTAVRERYNVDPSAPFLTPELDHMPEDDDLTYTVAALAIMEEHGRDFTSRDVADFWIKNIPLLRTCTAERVAHRNLTDGFAPGASAVRHNPYREWIGAQIRGDFWGYCNPGDPEKAAEMAWRDAVLSHVKNGVYGEMWVAAMVAAAFLETEMRSIIEVGLAQIPEDSRLAKAIRTQLEAETVDTAVESVHSPWDEECPHDWCHTISNAEVVASALLWGENDFARTICLAVETCFDTDCNGATAGSVLGVVLGASGIPEEWTTPINDTLETGVAGFERVKITEMARRTLSI